MKYRFCVYSEKKQRVDMYLSALFHDFSRSYIQKIIDRGQVQVNEKQVSKNIKIFPRDEISIEIITESLEIEAQNMNLDIIFEDENILILNKDSGVNVHPVPGEGGKRNTLVNGILYHCHENLPSINGVERPGIVHRLDKDTSGIILIAKNDEMMNYLSYIIKEREIKKEYLALVAGKIPKEKYVIESMIGRHPHNRIKMTTETPLNPKKALSEVELLDYIDEKYSLVKVRIHTGRTHQIRVHLSSIGYPIVGDSVYGSKKINDEVEKNYGLKRQALHAWKLEFELYGRKQAFEAELKEDMKRIIGEIR